MPHPDATNTGAGPGRAGAPGRLKRRLLVDRAAGWIIAAGGSSVVAAILLIFIFIGREALPLARGARLAAPVTLAPATVDAPLLVGADSYQNLAWRLDKRGLEIVDRARGGAQVLPLALDSLETVSAVGIDGACRAERFIVGTSGGRLLDCRVLVQREMNEGAPHSVGSFSQDPVTVETDSLAAAAAVGVPVDGLAWARGENGSLLVWTTGGRLRAANQDPEAGTWVPLEPALDLRDLAVTRLAVSPSGERVALADAAGGLHVLELEAGALVESWSGPSGLDGIRALVFLAGSKRLAAGDAHGALRSWLEVPDGDGRRQWKPGDALEGHAGPLTLLTPSPRDRSLLSVGEDGRARLHFATTGRTLLSQELGAGLSAAAFSPRGDALLLGGSRGLAAAGLANPHPELSWRALFGRVHYEGYDGSRAIWQSTGGSDDFEAKFSLLPLLFGTLKGTLFALLISVPLALLGAIYVSQFAPTWLARLIKPAIEIMAALPSVIVGFLAGLVFAPYLEQHLTAVLAFVLLLTLMVALMIPVWQRLPGHVLGPKGLPQLGLGAALVLAALALAFASSHWLDAHVFGGSLIAWLGERGGVVYDQRNSLVVGFALGFAVIPIIFTMSEDALSNVPDSLVSASLALGASRWTTVAKVVLPGAAAGVFAAIMIGLGRAIGETMIVLMATGNTPLMDLSPFNGFRSLSACIAVEIPEAPLGGTLYRLLFLMALLLFAFTFLINTAASWIGERLRKTHGRF